MRRRPFATLAFVLSFVAAAASLALAGPVAPEGREAVPVAAPAPADARAPVNPAIDMEGYLRIAREAAAHRESHRVSEAEFRRLASLPGTVILDARSREKYDELHVKGAVHLDFSDIAVGTLRERLPDRDTRILIYCNNNFRNAEGPFPSKLPTASLNLSTFIALYNYGYRNVWELGPLVDLKDSRLEFEGTAK